MKSIRALSFLTLFTPLYERGVQVSRIVQIQSENTRGSTQQVYEYLLSRLQKGESIAESLLAEHWPSYMIQGFHGFDDANPQAKREILNQLQALITNRVNILSDRIAGSLSFLGIVLGAASALTLAIGVYYPIFSATPNS